MILSGRITESKLIEIEVSLPYHIKDAKNDKYYKVYCSLEYPEEEDTVSISFYGEDHPPYIHYGSGVPSDIFEFLAGAKPRSTQVDFRHITKDEFDKVFESAVSQLHELMMTHKQDIV